MEANDMGGNLRIAKQNPPIAQQNPDTDREIREYKPAPFLPNGGTSLSQ